MCVRGIQTVTSREMHRDEVKNRARSREVQKGTSVTREDKFSRINNIAQRNDSQTTFRKI